MYLSVLAAAPLSRNEALARQLREDGIEHAYGWVEDMPRSMHAADVLVQNTGGLTSPEAFATAGTGTGVMYAIGRTLDLDGPPHAHHPEGHRS
ncbi:hypothetical protein ACFTUC_29895 [Streptomyces sp. NPDC056944]|uniref:hypothetical protein n=1 Tax=Streptomyces sp. NPDC056944 TaxID=3345972 RepID=UPI00363D5E29